MKAPFRTWLLLLCMAAFFILFALLPRGDFFPLNLRRIDLGLQEFSMPTSSPRAIAKPKPSTPVDTTSQRILLIGDSMVGVLSPRFSAYAKASGHRCHVITWAGSSTKQYARTATLTHYIKSYQPTLILLSLGSNELTTKDMERLGERVDRILEQLRGQRFVWISPPNWTEDFGLTQLIGQKVGKERFFDSSQLSYERGPDKRHPNARSGSRWADKVAQWLTSQATAQPIRLQKPKDNRRGSPTTFEAFPMNFKGF